MSIEVDLADLASALDRFAFAYLATVRDGRRTHVVAVSPVLAGDTLRIAKPGGTTVRNLGEQSAVTLVWPPSDPGDYSLIVDGTGVLDGDDLVVSPARAVLHRPAPPAPSATTGCASDCVELSMPEGT